MHKGIDFKVPIGTPVVAPADGKVIAVVTKKTGYGKYIKIKHDENFITLYAHLSAFNVKRGDIVKQGQQIGSTGNSGSSTAPHLHYEVIRNGKEVDPKEYL